LLLAAQGAALVFVAAAPDAVSLVSLQREGEAFGLNRAGGADCLGTRRLSSPMRRTGESSEIATG
jgi:hypothetical protein